MAVSGSTRLGVFVRHTTNGGGGTGILLVVAQVRQKPKADPHSEILGGPRVFWKVKGILGYMGTTVQGSLQHKPIWSR